MWLKRLFALILLLAGFQMISAQNKKEFFLYLLPESIDARQLSRLDLNKIKPRGKPFLTAGDVWRYVKETHEITLGYEATVRLKKLKVPVSGRPFIVFVGAEPIYTGAFWTSFSSITFRGVAIDVTGLRGDFATIKLELDYPPLAPKNIGFDPRPDKRIFQVFENKGVLYEQVWLSGRCRSVRPTGKRRQSYIFTFEVTSVAKSAYNLPEVTFEIFDDDEKSLRAAIDMRWIEQERRWTNFNPQREILLKFERRTNAKDPAAMRLRDFELK
jgi:hypothetical protein